MELQKTPLPDETIIRLYWDRDERAIEETDFKYKSYLFSIARNLLSDHLDCEECLSDTYLGAWNAMPPAKPNVLKAFLTTILRRAAIKRYHKNQKKSKVPSQLTVSLSELEEIVTEDGDVSAAFDAEYLGSVLSGFVRSLPARRQYIFMSRYYVSQPIDTIARELGVSRSTVNKELAAIRHALKEKLESEGYTL